ncbi:MAG: hypothetical protein ACT4ON_03115 [Bacteroidota bacterium]
MRTLKTARLLNVIILCDPLFISQIAIHYFIFLKYDYCVLSLANQSIDGIH